MVAALLVAALVACGGGGSGETASGDTASGEAGASDVGVTEDTITIALMVGDFSTLPDLPIRLELDDPEYGGIEHLLDEINDRGGIHGRRLELETFLWSPLDIPASLDAACIAAGDDADVFVAVTPLFVGEAAACLTGDKGVPTLFASSLPDDIAERSDGNALVLDGTALPLAQDALGILSAEGRLDDLGEVGIVTSDAPGLPELVDGVTAAFEALGGTVHTYQVTAAPLGSDPTHAVAAQNMLADGIDHVYPLVNGPNTASVMSESDLIGFSPTWLLTDHGERTSAIVVDNAPASQLENVLGVSSLALGYSDAAPLSDAAQQCIEFRNSIPDAPPVAPGTPTLQYAGDTCQLARVLEMLLDAAGPNPTRASFVEAATAIGPFENTAGAQLSFGPDKLSAPDEYRIVEYAPECTGMDHGCFLPTSDWVAAPR